MGTSHTNGHRSGDIEEVCRQFDSDLRGGKEVDISQLLNGWDEPERSRLLCELVSIEVESRVAAGRPVQPQEYIERFPSDREAIQEAFLQHRDEQTILPAILDDRLQTESALRHLRFLAEGGLGQVYIAEDEKLRRDAAVKLIREDLASDADSCDQFKIEAEVTGRLAHPGIPVVYALGQTNKGRLFYAMQYVRGTRLDRLIRHHHREFSHAHGTQWFGLRRHHSIRKNSSHDSGSHSVGEVYQSDSASTPSLDLRELLEIFISVCHTIGYAHRRGILHRDIKPSNVIHGKFGETIVIDWGLALPVARQGVFKDVAEQTLAPRSGKSSRQSVGCVGTPAFMSPEQASGNVPLTPASDIFSLGTMLYCILTGAPPYQGNSAMETRKLAIDCAYPKPSAVIETIPAALEAICLKAMRPQVSERYRTTHDMVADIRAYLADRPVSACPDRPYRRLARWTRHNTQWVLGTMLGLLIVASSVGFYAMWKSAALQREQQTSRVESNRATEEKSLRERSLIMAADLAARTLANKIDIIYRTLELRSTDSDIQAGLQAWNESQDEASARSIQDWLNSVVAAEPKSMQFRSWFVMGRSGTTIARTPAFSEGGKRSSSIGKNFAFRDYFHGLGQDLPPTSPASLPLEMPHNSAAIFSTTDSQLTVYFSVPVVDLNSERIGALVVCVDCRDFGDLRVEQPKYQKLMLVEGRRYPLRDMEWSDELGRAIAVGQAHWSAGILLHHQDPQFQPTFDKLPRLSDDVFQAMNMSSLGDDGQSAGRLFDEGIYEDPLQPGDRNAWIAAYSPVRLDTRSDAQVANTGWFVIVQQEMVQTEATPQ